MLKVLKYGGSSVATTNQIKDIANYIKKLVDHGDKIVVVASAMGKTTNNLIKLANEITFSPSKREMDALLSTGELQTVSLLAIALQSLGIKAVSLTGFQSGFVTDENHSKAFIKNVNTENLQKFLDSNYVCVVAGFQGISSKGNITTLGRGGSDTTAVALASMLKCPCEIYTDVESVYTIDPRIYPSAKKLHKISYDEMMEMAASGAKVLETRCVELAKKYKVLLYLGKTLEEDKSKGTYVMENDELEQMPVTNISVKEDVAVVNLHINKENENCISEIFNIIDKCNINLDMINKSYCGEEIVFIFSTSNSQSDEFYNEFNSNRISDKVKIIITKNLCKIVLVGVGMATHTGIATKVFKILDKNNISYSQITTSEISISFTTDLNNKLIAVNLLAKAFEL